MNYQAFTNETLLMMHHGARGALAVDDELAKLGDRTIAWLENRILLTASPSLFEAAAN